MTILIILMVIQIVPVCRDFINISIIMTRLVCFMTTHHTDRQRYYHSSDLKKFALLLKIG